MTRRLFLFLIFAMALLARGASEPRTPLPESIKVLDRGQVRSMASLKPGHLGRQIEFQIALRMRDFAKMLARVEHGEVIGRDELEAKYLPLPANYQAVITWAKGEGLTVTGTDPLRLGVFVKGTVAQVQTALRTEFAEVTVADGTYTSAVSAPSVPSHLAAAILGVNGLQPHIHPHHIASAQPQTADSPPYLVKEILGAFGASNLGYDGTGETIAILIDTFPASSDLQNFWASNGIPQNIGNVKEIQAVAGSLPAVSGEETLDTEWTSGIASGAKIRVYATTDLSFTDLDKGLERIISDLPSYSIHELSISLGLGETEVSSSQKLTDAQYFLNLANSGVSVFVSSGDDGAVTDGVKQPSYYSSDPSVTGVGGTTLYLTGDGSISSESAWNGSGGGTSQFFSRPSWQTGEGVPAGSMRLVPDVACPADPNTGAYVYLQGTAQQIGGTSWAAPTWAGFCALINQARAQAGLGPLGLLNPKIYPLIGTASFHDITSGNNGGYSAGIGYDEVTGIGTPAMDELLPALTSGASSLPAITSFSPVAGPVGTAVTINGFNLARVTTVQFNGVTAGFGPPGGATLTGTVPVGATTGPITLLSGTNSTSSTTDFTVVPLATNGTFADATVISGTAGSVQGTNIGATVEAGAPVIGGPSVWWSWQAPDNGTYTFNTIGSNFDTVEAVWTGTAVDALTLTGSNDDYGTGVTSSVTFTATAGTVYYIDLAGYEGATGAITLNWEENKALPVISNFTPETGRAGTEVTITGANFSGVSSVLIGGAAAAFTPGTDTPDTQMTAITGTDAVTGPISMTGPLGTTVSSANFVVVQPVSNDYFVNAQVISGESGVVTGNNEGATKEQGEPDIEGNAGGKSIWYVWTPAGSSPVTFTTFGSSFNTLLAVYTGTNVADLTLVAQNNNYGNTVNSSVTFVAQSGTTYHISVDGFNGASGNVVLNWSKTSSLPSIAGFSPTSGPAGTTITITGSDFTGATAVAVGSVPLSFTVVSDNEITALVSASAATGLVSVGNLLGTVESTERFTVTAVPSNDDFVNATPLTGSELHVTGANVGATREPGEPEIEGNPGGASVWWAWTPTESGEYAVSTLGSSFATLLGVYTGTAVNTLTLVAQSDSDPAGGVTSYLTMSAMAGVTYRIAVDGLYGATGSIVLSIYPQQASTTLYSTGFESTDGFLSGQPLGGQSGWLAVGSGGNGIVTGFDGMPGQQAYVGFDPPTNPADDGVDVYYPIDYAAAGTAQPVVIFSVTMAINDSTNFNYDDFEWLLFNKAGHNFFTIDFANEDLEVYYAQEGSNQFVDTGVQFANNTPMQLVVTMDFNRNNWSATLDGAALIPDQPIRTSKAELEFGDMDAAWAIYDPNAPGDNYMLFDNYSVVAEEDPAPHITFQPLGASVVEGNPVTLSVVATGQAPLYYQWLLNGKDLPGATEATLSIPDAEPVNAGLYKVNVSNSLGLITSHAVRLTVTQELTAPVITKQPASITVAAGSTAVFKTAATGNPVPGYQWYLNGAPIAGAKRAALAVHAGAAGSKGNYMAVASNAIGSSTTSVASLDVGNSFTSQRGIYAGTVDMPSSTTAGGMLKVAMNGEGGFSGVLALEGKTYRAAGAFDAEGMWQGVVGKAGTTPITLSMQLALSGSSAIAASIIEGGTTQAVTALRDNYSAAANPAPQKGSYTMTLTGTDPSLPQGTGYAAVSVDAAGVVRATGKLGDGTPFSFSSALSDSGAWPFYAALYGHGGYAGGTLTFESVGQTDLDGTLFWTRPAGFGSAYTGGFSANVTAAGYTYVPPAGGKPAIPLGAGGKGTIAFSGGPLAKTVSGALSVNASGRIVPGTGSGIELSLNRTTGVFTGSVQIAPGETAPFYGVLLRKPDAGAGLFQWPPHTGATGSVQITSP